MLWNIYYDEVTKLQMSHRFSIVGYADDLAIVATANTERNLQIVVVRPGGKKLSIIVVVVVVVVVVY